MKIFVDHIATNKMYVALWARFKFLVLSFKQRSVSWDNLLIFNQQRYIYRRWQ